MIWIVYLSIIGICLMCLEMFLPGMVIGIIGACFLLFAVALTYWKFGPSRGNAVAAVLFVVTTFAVVAWLFIFPKTRGARQIITSEDLAGSKSSQNQERLIGKKGRTITPLRPSGTALLNEERIDVVAETGWIDTGKEVHVTRVAGSKVFVNLTPDVSTTPTT